MTSTVAYSTATPSVARVNRDREARIAAAARVSREREAREARVARDAAKIDAALTRLAPGATSVGVKIIERDGSKWRARYVRAAAPEMIARHWADGDSVEYWPVH